MEDISPRRYPSIIEPTCLDASSPKDERLFHPRKLSETAPIASPTVQRNYLTEASAVGILHPLSYAPRLAKGLYPFLCQSCGSRLDALNRTDESTASAVPPLEESSKALLKAPPGLSWSPAETTTEPVTPDINLSSSDLDFGLVIESQLWPSNSFSSDFELFGPDMGPSDGFEMIIPRTHTEKQGYGEVPVPLVPSTQLMSPPSMTGNTPSARTLSRNRKYKCPHPCCGSSFASKNDLERHLSTRKHRKDAESLERSDRFRCPHSWCKRSRDGFGRKDHFTRHMNTMHPVLGNKHSEGNSVNAQ